MTTGKNILNSSNEPYKISYDTEMASRELSLQLGSMLPSDQRPVVIVCIGTDRSTGDSLGPLVGTFLQEKRRLPYHIYGNLDKPVHALNLEETLKTIESEYENPFIIGIDACLGRMKSVGTIQLADGPVRPGAGVHKSLPEVGNIHMTGIVNLSGFMEVFVLQNTRLNLVFHMAKIMADSIEKASYFSRTQKQTHVTFFNYTQLP